MEKTKAAVQSFVTTVYEIVAPAVVHEHVTKIHREEVQPLVDREIHQDHYHTTIQPVTDREIRPEEHHHNAAPVEYREHHHGDSAAVKAKAEEEAGQYKGQRTEGETQYSSTTKSVIGAEHRHHHVHEIIQPIIRKEIVQSTIVHTTVPVHEIHYTEAKHHSASALPALTMAEFKQKGGTTTGREIRHYQLEGETKMLSNILGGLGNTQPGTWIEGNTRTSRTSSSATSSATSKGSSARENGSGGDDKVRAA